LAMEFEYHRGAGKARMRPVQQADWNRIVGWWNDSEVQRLFDSHFVNQTFSDVEKWFKKREQWEETAPKSFIVEVEEQGKWHPVGIAEFFDERPGHKTAEFGFLIGEKNWWGKGLGTECARIMVRYGLEEIKYHRIGAVSAAYNIRSLNALQKAGFQIEGVRKGYVLRDGEYHDQIQMAVLNPKG
jgi:RimJ/RimL family protein N-acetyltransferase